MNGVEFFQLIFCINRYDYVGFPLKPVNLEDYIDGFSNIDPALHSQHKSNLVAELCYFYILLDLRRDGRIAVILSLMKQDEVGSGAQVEELVLDRSSDPLSTVTGRLCWHRWE